MSITDELEAIQAELDEEGQLWQTAGISIDHTSHTNGSIFILKQQIQALINALLIKGAFTEDELNLEFKKLLLSSLRELREAFGPAIEQARINAMMGRDQEIAVPKLKLLGPDGKEVNI